jgi:hypothetical protein
MQPSQITDISVLEVKARRLTKSLLKWGLSCYLSTLESTSLLQDKQEDRNNG